MVRIGQSTYDPLTMRSVNMLGIDEASTPSSGHAAVTVLARQAMTVVP